MAGKGALDLSRVVVVGTSCSGKSTFARDLAGRLRRKYIELDALYWLPGWAVRDPDEFKQLVAGEAEGKSWVTDGNYRTVRDLLWPKATAIIWLDYPFPLVLWRSLKRSFHRAFTRQEICNGNIESWRILFSRESIVLWVVKTHGTNRERYQTLFADGSFPASEKIQLTSPAAAKDFLAQIEAV